MDDAVGGSRASTEPDDFWVALVERRNDVPALLRLIAERVASLLGDGCVLTILSEDGRTLEPRAVVHTDPDVASAMRAVLATQPARVGEGVAGTVAAARRPVLLNDLEPGVIAETTPQQFLPFVRDHPMRAMVIAPLVAGADLVGTLGAIRTTSTEPYTLADLRLLEALATRAALVIAESTASPRAVGLADFEALYRHHPDGVLITTPDGHFLAANPAACSLLRRSEQEILAGGRDDVLEPGDRRVALALEERARSGHVRGELTVRRGDDTTLIADVSSTIFMTPDGRTRTIVDFRDVSEEVRARESVSARLAELQAAANRDPLTGLRNRRGFAIAAEQALAAADRDGMTAHLVFVDVNGLKAINDAYGHAAGDDAIVAAGAAIDRSLREVDVSCRLGGDEFVFLVVGATGNDLPVLLNRIGKELATDPAAPSELTVSTGRVERPPGMAATLDQLIEAADRDMYQQKMLHRLRRPD